MAVTLTVAPGAKTAALHEARPAVIAAVHRPVATPPETAEKVTEPVADDGVTAADQVAVPSPGTGVVGRVIEVELTARCTVSEPVVFDPSRRASP